VLLLVFQELYFLLSLLSLNFLALSVTLVDSFNLRFQFAHFVFELGLLVLELLDCLLQVGLSVLGLQLFSHGESDRRLIQGLVSSNRHLDLVSHSKKKKSSLWLAESYLSNDFIEALREKLLSDRTDATFSGLPFHELLIEHLSKPSNINSRSWLMADVLNVVLSKLNPLSGREDSVKDIFATWFCVHRWELLLLGTYEIEKVRKQFQC